MAMQLYPVSLAGGINLLQDATAIRDDEARRLKNIYPNISGMPAKRLGATYKDRVRYTGLTTPYPTNMLMLDNPAADYILSFTQGPGPFTHYLTAGSFQTGASVGLQYPATPFEVTALDDRRPQMVNYASGAVAATGVPNAVAAHLNLSSGLYGMVPSFLMATPSFGALPYYFLGRLPNEWHAPKVVGTYRGRMVYANFGPTYELAFGFGDGLEDGPMGPGAFQFLPKIGATSLGSGNSGNVMELEERALFLPSAGRDEIVAVLEVTTSDVASPLDSVLLILTQNRCFIMTGETELSTYIGDQPSGSAQVNEVQVQAGCCSAETVVRTPHGVLWANHEDVWGFEAGKTPRRIGTKIRPALLQSRAGDRYLWHAEYDATLGAYMLAVISLDQDVGGGVTQSCLDQYWLDIRGGIPPASEVAKWYGEMRYKMPVALDTSPSTQRQQGTFIMRRESRWGQPAATFAVHVCKNPDNADASSLVFVELNRREGYDSAYPFYNEAGSVTNEPAEMVDNEIDCEILTKAYDFEDRLHDKIAEGVEASMVCGDVVQLTCETIVDGGRIVSSRSIQVDQVGFIGGVDSLDDTRERRQFQGLLLSPDEGQRLSGKTLQFRIFDTPGFPVVRETALNILGIDSQFMVRQAGSVPSGKREVFLTAGFYAQLKDFVDHLCAVFGASFGGSFTNNQTYAPTLTYPVSITSPAGALTFFFSPSTETERRTRKIGVMMGYDTSVDQGPSNPIVAAEAVHNKIAAHLEFGQLVLRINHLFRRPRGAYAEEAD